MVLSAGTTRSRLVRSFCIVALLLSAALAAAQAGKRLILKDGSWQDVTKYEVNGDRVRYFSPYRFDWEEVPRDLVDWPATEKWNSRPSPAIEDEEESRESHAPDPLQLAPGLKLPRTGGVFVLDRKSGELSLVELSQEQGVLTNDTSGVFHSSLNRKGTLKQRLEMKGPHAARRIHVPKPTLFVKIAASEVPAANRFRIVPLIAEKTSRIMGTVSVSLTGKQSSSQQFVPAYIENFREGWLEITPSEPLNTGEYALVEMLDATHFNVFAWDFGIDAPEEANTGNATSGAEHAPSPAPDK